MRFVLAGTIAAAIAFPAIADQTTLVADRDATIYNEDDDASNGGGEYFIVGNNPDGDIRRALIHFDLSAIPPGSVVHAAFLELQLSITRAGDVVIDAHRITRDWGEGMTLPVGGSGGGGAGGGPAADGDVTWGSSQFNIATWTTPGGDFNAAPSASATVGDASPPALYTWTSATLDADIQDWINDPATNHGLILLAPPIGANGKRFFARENPFGVPPQLFVDFTPPNACICEFGGDPDTVSILDLTAFLSFYFATTGDNVLPGTGADVDASGVVNITDILTFLQCWFPASAGADC